MFKDITSRWTYLKFNYGLRVKQQPVGLFYIVAADLTNLSTVLNGRSQASIYFNCAPPSLEDYLAPRVYCEPAVVVANNDAPPIALVDEAVHAGAHVFDYVEEFPAEPLEEAFAHLQLDDVNEYQLEQLVDGFGNLNFERVWAYHINGPRQAEV